MDKDGNYVINPHSGKQMKDANGKKVFDADGKPVIDPKTLKPFATTDNIYEIAALPEGEEKTRRQNALHKYRQMTHAHAGLRAVLQQHLQLHDQMV